MKKQLRLFIILILSFPLTNLHAQNTWQAWDPFPWDPGLGVGNDAIYDIAFDANNVPWLGEGYVNFNPRTIAWLNNGIWDTLSAPSAVYNS